MRHLWRGTTWKEQRNSAKINTKCSWNQFFRDMTPRWWVIYRDVARRKVWLYGRPEWSNENTCLLHVRYYEHWLCLQADYQHTIIKSVCKDVKCHLLFLKNRNMNTDEYETGWVRTARVVNGCKSDCRKLVWQVSRYEGNWAFLLWHCQYAYKSASVYSALTQIMQVI